MVKLTLEQTLKHDVNRVFDHHLIVEELVEHRTAKREVADSNLNRTNTQSLKITEEKMIRLSSLLG